MADILTAGCKVQKIIKQGRHTAAPITLKGVLKMTKDEVKKELDRIFGEYTDFEDISNALLELPADIVDEIFSE